MKSIFTYLHHQFRPSSLKQVLGRVGCPWSTSHKLLRQNKITLLSLDSQLQEQLTLDTNLFFMDRLQIANFTPAPTPLIRSREANPALSFQKLTQMVITANNHVFLLNKLNSVSTQGDLSPNSNLYSLLKSVYPESYISIVHRVDRAASGSVIVARNQEAAARLHVAINQREVSKVYIGLTQGVPTLQLIQAAIQYTSKNQARVSQQGKRATTKLIVVGQHGKATLVLIKIKEGRKHQIRCHLSQVCKTPILNDCKYKAARVVDEDVIFLHSFVYGIRKDVVGQGLQGQFGTGKVLPRGDRLYIVSKIPEMWGIGGKLAAQLQQKALAFALDPWGNV